MSLGTTALLLSLVFQTGQGLFYDYPTSHYPTSQGVPVKIGQYPCRKTRCRYQGEICVVDNHNRPRCMCPLKCPQATSSQSVCGDDTYTYSSICEMNRTACNIGATIKALHRGQCGKPPLPEVTQRPSVRRTTLSTSGHAQTPAPTTAALSGLPLRCQQPKEVGSCPQYRFSVKWYYSAEEKACKPFIYLGCVGANVVGKNNFVTREQCTSICKEKDAMQTAVCPPVDPPAICLAVIFDQCQDDEGCQLGLKCCSNGCFRKCVKPILQGKPGRCPKPSSDIDDCEGIQKLNDCSNDHDCESDMKCCGVACGRTCVKPAAKEKLCRTIVDVAFLIDSSGSIRRSQWPVMLSFVKKIIGSLEISPQGNHVAAVSYSTDPKVDFTFNSFTGDQLNQKEINNAIDSIRHMRGYTFIDKALKLVNQDVFTTAGGMRNAVKKMLFVFTDGFQTKNKPYTPLDQASKPIKDKGIDIWSIGIGRAMNKQELKQMASKESNVITVGSFDDLQTILDKLRVHICKEPELTKCQTKHREALKTARPGDFIPQCKGDGSFENVQCHSMECYCVDQEGNEIYGTRARIEAGRPQCIAAARKATPCQIAYRQAVDDHVFGAHIPRCKSDGRYEEIQCEGRTGYCWCVDNDGRELPGTRTRRHLKCPHPDPKSQWY